MVTYRRKKDSDTWHWNIKCSEWPITDYIEPTRYRELDKKCNECRSLDEFDKQAQAFYDTSPLKNIPHWYITIRPTASDENYIIKDFPKYFEKIKSFSNDWGVWDYPYVDLGPGCYNRDEGKDWIQSWYNYDILGFRQCWRFYRSGLFVHLRSFLEEDKSLREEAEKQTKSFNTDFRASFNRHIDIRFSA